MKENHGEGFKDAENQDPEGVKNQPKEDDVVVEDKTIMIMEITILCISLKTPETWTR